MRVVHFSDCHLGYRAYNRVTSQGINRREADIFQAFRQVLKKVSELDPDLILIAGDLFHVVRPSNLTIQQTFREFINLRERTAAPCIIIGGNHDSPRSVDTGCILDLFSNLPSFIVVHNNYEQVKLPKLDTSVFCLSHRALPELNNLKLEPDKSSKFNLLMVHGTVEGVFKQSYDIYEIRRSDVINESWDYIAFGHYHTFTELAPNAYYSGSIEYTSPNFWSELGNKKGFIEYNLAERKLVDFHSISTREVIDLRPIDADGRTVGEIDQMIKQRVESISGGYEDKIIRLIVLNLNRSVQKDLDFKTIREYRTAMLHFDLQLKPPQTSKHNTENGAVIETKSLEEEWDSFVKDIEIPVDINREEFRLKGREYLSAQSRYDGE
ncbi:MAG: exonuclease SbcCD subunit D [Armatimonadota bacterium]